MILTLALGGTQTEAAAASGFARGTVRKRLRDPHFRALVAEERRRVMERAAAKSAGLAATALNVLATLMSDDKPAIRLRASDAILRHLLALSEHVSLGERLAALEADLREMITTSANDKPAKVN